MIDFIGDTSDGLYNNELTLESDLNAIQCVTNNTAINVNIFDNRTI